ncbi:phage tail protein [Klebsiella pneumoniae]
MEVPNFKKSRLSQLITHGLIISGRGGSKGGGGARTPVEANDTVNSRAMASVLDLLGEGVIGGLVDGAKSILLNDTPLQNADGSYNFSGVTWWFRDGSQDQTVIDGFDFIETPKSVGMQLKQTSQVNVSLDSADSDRVRVVMKFPSLRKIDKKSGDTNGTTVQYKFQIDAGNGKGFVDAIAEGEGSSIITLTAKKTGVYYRSYVFDLPKPAKSYTLRAIRLTEDHKDDSYLYDDTYIDSIGEIVNTSLNYPNSALVGLKINSEQFGSTMPSRSYLIKGLKIRVPSNYNADTNSYDGNWDGTFKLASSSNPAWILFDLLTNTRYGLGEFVKESMINIGELYQIGRYCDAFVDDGFGGKEKRFAINTQITSRQDAYRVVQDIAGAFRGMVYWAGGMVHITQDSPADPVMLFSNSNVVNGSFAYKGSARKDRYSVALITYNNKEDGYKQSVEYVEDQEAIKRYGIRKTESVAFGCTSRGQAHRVGLWTLYTSRMESDVITFAVGMDSVFLMPGDIVLIADKFRAGRRNSGRIIGYTSNSIKLDAPVDLTSVGNHITFLSAEGKMVERDILENGKNITTVTFKTALSSNETPVNDAVWVIAQPDLTPLQARVVSVAEGDDGTSFNITAIQNNPTKYEAIDSGAQLIPQNTTVLDPTFSKPSGLAITEGTYLSSPGNLSVSLTATWQGKSAQYYISWRRSDAGNVSNWKSERVTEEQFELRGVAENGQYDFQVYAVSVGGRKTDPISITYKVLGTLSAPGAPTGLTAVGDYRSIVLNWVNPASVDLDHIEVLASKTNDKSKAQLIAKVSGTTFSHNGLEDSVTWYYWVRAANKRGMLSALNSPLATTATTRDVLSFLKNKITESELGQDLIADIDSKAVATEVDAAIEEAKSQATSQIDDARAESANAVNEAKKALNSAISKETTDRTSAIAGEASARAKAIADEVGARNKAISDEASARAKAISDEVDARNKAIANEAFERAKAISGEADARSKAIADEVSARAKAISDEASTRASAISDSIAVEASNRAKAISDSVSSLNAKIEKEVRDRSAAVSALDTKTANAISEETSNRIATIESEARARADGLLQEKNNRQSEIQNLSTQMQTANESLAQQISQIAAGTGEQFDSLNIWYFDTDNEGWTEDDGSAVPMNVTSDGWLKAANSTSTCRSPNNMAIDANAYRFIKLRIKKVGKPVWAGKLLWIGASEQGWSDARSITLDEPEYDANGVATLSIHDIDWRASTTIRRLRFDFLKGQDDKNYLLIDWIAVGRPTPGAGMAALQNEKAARVDADAAEAANRNALAVQMRGSYDGNDLSKVGSGLIFQEQQARVAADKAEATARQSLETKVNDSVSNINKSLDTLSTQDKAMASDITGLKSSLKDKADASALQTLKTSVDQQGSSISTQGQSITKLRNDLNTTNANVGKKADQTALTALQGTVTQQGKDISAANSSITNLKTSLDTTNNNVAKKADATAVNDLTSRVSATEGKVSSQADSIVQLNNSLSNAIADSDVSTKTPNNLIVNPSFERGTDGYIGVSSLSSVITIQAPHSGTKALMVAPGNSAAPGQYVDFVKDRTYEIGVWVKQISGTTDNGSGNNKLRVGSTAGNPVFELPFTGVSGEWTKFSRRWKATETASLPVTLSNYLTAGNRYFDDFYVIDVTDSVKIDANASALSSLQNTVTQQGKDIASQSTSITSLSNQMVNGRQNMWVRSIYSVQLANNTTEPTFSDINGKAPISIDEVPDAAKLDFASAGSYVIAHYKAFVKVNADTTITMAPGFRVFDDTGAVYVNGVRVAFGNAGWNTVSFDLKAGWSTVEFLVNQWTGQAYINLGFKLSEKVAQLNSALGMNALSNAISAVTSNVSTVGDRVTSTSQSVTDLRNSLEQTNANLANKADAQALSALQNTVTQQGKDIASASSSIASLKNNLSTTNANVAKKADATALNALQNTVTQQGSSISSQGNSITQLQNELTATNANVSKKADASALASLQNTVTQQGKDITSASSDISLLKNSLATTDANVAKKADSSALSSLQSTVTQQGKDLSSVGNRTTNLENNLKTTVANVSKKADASAVDTLQNTVTQQGKDITSASDAITSLNNSVGAMTNMGDNLIQDANLEGDGSAFSTQQNGGTTGSIVAFGAYGENSAGARMLKVNATSPGLFANGKKPTPVNGSRKFRYIVRAKGVSGSMNMLLRRWNFNGSAEGNYEDKNVTLTSDWQTITWDTSFSPRTGADGQAFGIYCHPSNAEIWIDSFQVFDITDAVNNDETASALSDLSTKVTKQGDTVSSQGTSITKLQNDLTSMKTDVSKKADASALQTLKNTVTDQGKTLISQGNAITTLTNTVDTVKGDVAKKADATALNNLSTRVSNAEDKISSSSDAITSLNSSLNQQSKRGANILPDGTFESYSNGYNLSNNRVIVTTDDAQGGSRCIRVTRPNDYTNYTDNSDNHIFGSFQVRDNAVFYLEYWAKLDANKANMAANTQISVGLSVQYQDNSWQWPSLTKAVKDLSATSWTKVSGYLKLSKSGVKQAMARISVPNVSTVKAGDSFLIDNIVLTEVTDAYNAQELSNANASAIQTLNSTVDKNGSDIASQGSAITKLQNDLGTTNANVSKKAEASALQSLQNTVTDQGKTLTSQGSSLTSLNNTINTVKDDVAKKADASALQTLQSTVTQQGKDITSANSRITSLTNGLATTDSNVAKKADATALSSLQNTVTQQGKDIASTTNNLDSLSNQLTNGKVNTWSRRIYKLQLASNATEPTFSDIQGLSPYLADEVADAAKLDFASFGSYVIAHYKAFVRVDADTKITMSPGSRVFDDTGAVYVNDARAAAGGANTGSIGIMLKAGWNTVEFLVNQWTGQAYVNLGLKISDNVKEMYSVMGVAALSSAISEVSSNVSRVGDTVTSNSSDITKLANSLASTDANVAKKADSSALSSLQNTVTQQGNTLSSQGNSITSLRNSLSTTDGKVAKKAEQSAVDSLTGRVTKTENDITAANIRVTSLNAAIRAGNASSGDLIPNPTFDVQYDSMGFTVISTDSAGVPAGCPFKYAAKLAARDHHPNFNTIVATVGDVFEISALVACGAGSADFNLYIGTANGPTGGVASPLYAGGNTKTTSTWKRVTWKVTVPQSAVDKGYLRPFLQINQSSPFGTVWYVTDWHMRNITAAAAAQSTADATSKAVDSLTSTVTQQGKDVSSVSARATALENGLSTANTNIGKKADASALQTLQNTVTQQGKDLSTQSDSLTNLSNSLSNVSVGGTNLISLSGTMDGWGSKISETFRGNAVCGATTKAGGSYRDLKEVIIDAPVDNAEYVYSFYAKGGVNGQSMTVFFYNPNTTESSETSQGVKASNTDGRAAFTLTTEWVRYWVKWKQRPGTGAKRLIIARIEASTKTDQTVYVSSPKMEVGNMPTEWSPAPADLAASADLSSLQTTVAANSSSIQSVTSRVSNVEGTVSSQGTALTSLQNSLNTTNSNVSKKADASALQTLQNTVTQQGNDISGQGSRVTSLENNLTAGANLIPNPAMLNGAQGWGGSATTVDGYAAVVSSSGWGPSSSYFQVTPGDIIDLSLMSQSAGAASISWGLRFDGPGLSNFCLYAPALTFAAGEKKSVSAAITVPAGATKAMFQASARATSARTVYNIIATRRDAGTKANSSAIDTLTSTVQTQGDAISSVGGRTTSLENSLKTTNDNVSKKADSTTVQTLQNTVTQQGKDISAAGTNITSMQASLTRRTVFTVTAKGNGNSANHGLFDESGKNLFTPGRSYALITFKANSDGSTVINTSKTYDVFGSANNGKAMSDDIAALANGVYVCVMTYDEPSGQRNSIASALELLGGTTEVINSLPYRGAYILLGRKGMKAGDGLELRAPTGGDSSAFISTSVEFVNGVMMGLGAAGGVMMKADANASAITTLQNTVTQQGKDITSASSAITSLQNGLVTANSNIDKKADATALQTLQNTVTQQGKDISTQSGNVTNLQNSLSATNTGLANLVADSDASKKIIGNLLTNSSFERGLEGFSGGASFIKVIDAQSPNSGSKILSCGAGTGTVSQSIAVTKDRTYKIGAFARCQSGTVVDNQSNNKLRIGNSSLLADFMFKPTDLPTGSTWKEISGTWKATVSGSVDVSINSSLKSGNQYFDDFYFIDITDIVNIDATSNAVASLTSRVTSAEGTVSSHTGSITNLSNSLNSLNNTVSGKADASALQSLQNTVTQQGKDLSSASGSITSLQSSLNTIKVQSNPWIDGTFETYDNNQQLGGSTAIVTTDFKSSGSKCLKVTRPANTSGNSDKTIGSYSAVRQSAKYRVEFWAMMPASEAPPSGWTVVVGLHSINKDGGNDWQGITFNEAGLGGRDQWVKFTGVVKVSPSVTRSHVWISTRGQSGSNTPGYAVYIDDFVITDITDAADAQATADANATAISSLQTKVSDIDGKVTAQTSQLSSMQSKVDASSSKVDQLSKTISDSQSTQASLNTSLQSQIDAQASANIKNQADLNSATTSIASIKSTQATQATQISAMAKTQTDMTASLNSQSASIQTLQEAVSNNDALNSTWMVKMQTNNNGQKYAAGIALGVDGKNMQSQFLVQADRFALINTSNGNTTTPFVIDNGVTYMNAAYIKDGSIGSAKVGDLMSSGFQENVRGWRISRDGTMNINGSGPGSSRTVITNGKIEVYDSNNRLRVRMGIF